MKRMNSTAEIPEIVEAKCRAAYAQIYKECETMGRKHKIKMKKKHIIAACAAAALVIVPTTAIAYEYISARIEQTGTYQNTVIIPPQETQTAESIAETTAQFMALEIGWLPEGYNLDEAEGKYYSAEGGGITCQYLKLPADMTVTEQLRNTVSSEQYAVDGKQILISERADNIGEQEDQLRFNRELWVVFDGTSYAVRAWLTSDLSDADVEQFAEGLTLTPSDVETAGDYIPAETGSSSAHTQATAPAVLRDELHLIAVGETATINYTGFYNDDTISMTVNEVDLQKNFDGITENCGKPVDYTAYLDGNGNVADIVRTWYNQGDGVDTLDEDVLSETIPQNVLVMQVTYTNDSDHAVEHTIFPTLFTIVGNEAHLNGQLRSDIADMNTDFLHPLLTDATCFSIQSESDMDKNKITIPAGESVDVQLAFLVGEDMLGSLYMNMYQSFELSTPEAPTPVLDLCGIQ